MTNHEELSERMNALLRAYGQWREPNDTRVLKDDESELVRLLAEDRLAPGTPSHAQAIELVAGSIEARYLWNTFIGMQQIVEQDMLKEMEQSMTDFFENRRTGTTADYGAQVISLVERLKLRNANQPQERGQKVQRLAAETAWDTVGRGKYVAGDLAMSLVFSSMEPQATPTGFLITCPMEAVHTKYEGKLFRVLFVEPESQASEPLQHRTLDVGPFDSSGEIEVRFDDNVDLGKCVVPVWVDLLNQSGEAT